MPMTVGEAVQRNGYCVVMLKLVDLAQAVGRIPVGEWDYRFVSDPTWRVCMNGGASATWTPPDAPAIPRFESYLAHQGWPAALVNAAGGHCMVPEDRIIAAIEREIAALTKEGSSL